MIEIKNGSKGFNESKKLFSNLNLQINQGEFVAILGKSGAGKSTLLNILALFDTLDSGELIIDNCNVRNLKESQQSNLRNQKFGFIFQSYHLIGNMSVLDNVILPKLYSNKPLNLTQTRTLGRKALKAVGMDNYQEREIDFLSGGEMQRVSLARALINNPTIIFADEPTGNLDQENTENIIKIFKQLQHDGKTIILVTHDETLANRCDYHYIIDEGNIVKHE